MGVVLLSVLCSTDAKKLKIKFIEKYNTGHFLAKNGQSVANSFMKKLVSFCTFGLFGVNIGNNNNNNTSGGPFCAFGTLTSFKFNYLR